MQYAVVWAVTFCLLIYIVIASLAVSIYGEYIEHSVLDNFSNESTVAAQVVRIVFLTIFLTNAPYRFHPIRTFAINIVFEARERLFSKRLED